MTIDEIANRVGKSHRTIRVWIAEGYLKPVYKDGRVHHYRESDALDAERRVRRGLPPASEDESVTVMPKPRRRYPLTEAWIQGDYSFTGQVGNPFLGE